MKTDIKEKPDKTPETKEKIERKKFRKKFSDMMILLSLPALLYFAEGPLTVYVSNAQDFSFHYQDFFYALCMIGIAVLLAAALFGALLPERIHRLFGTLILYFGVMSLAQDMFMNIKLAEVDGSNMRWEELRSYTAVNTAVWIVALALFILFYFIGYKKLQNGYDKFMVWTAGLLALLQAVGIVSVLIPAIGIANQAKSQGNYGVVGEGQYQMAAGKNIVVFVVDSFGSSQFEYVLERNPDVIRELHDFTYYENTDSCYTGTFPSMTFMLTGVPLDFERKAQGYLESAWTDEAVREYYEKIHGAGYSFRLYSNGGRNVYGNMKNMEGLIDNVVPVELNIDKKAVLIRMMKISIYKYVPYIMKPRFEVPSHMFMSLITYAGRAPVNCGNSLFYDGLREYGLSINEQEENAVIILHLDGMHPPNDTASDGSYQPGSSLQETEEGVFLILGYYLEQLKELGIYDDTAIIITADHGRWDVMEHADDPQIVFFMKTAGQRQEELTRSSAPISLADLRASILELMGENSGDYGTSVFDWKNGDLRERVVTHLEKSNDYPDVPGEACNIYAEYIYTGDYGTLTNYIREHGADVIYPNPGQ